VAGDADPEAIAADPGVGEARAEGVGFAFVGAGFAVNAGGYGGVAVDLNGDALVVEVISFCCGAVTHFRYSDLFMKEPS
jgi:hypothetical protein